MFGWILAVGLLALEAEAGTSIQVERVCAGETWVYWLRRSGHPETLLINAGSDPSARALRTHFTEQAISPFRLTGILLTDGRVEETAGLRGLPDLPILVHEPDLLLATGHVPPHAWLARLAWRVRRPKVLSRLPKIFSLKTPLVIGGLEVSAVPLPGHTKGSIGIVVGDTVYTGGLLYASHQEHRWFSKLSHDRPEWLRSAQLTVCRLAQCSAVRFVASSRGPIRPIAEWCAPDASAHHHVP